MITVDIIYRSGIHETGALEELIRVLNKYMRGGWKLQGGVSVTYSSWSNKYIAAHTIYKEIETENNAE